MYIYTNITLHKKYQALIMQPTNLGKLLNNAGYDEAFCYI